MRFLDLVKKRRSCRNYSSRDVSKEMIERCIEAARLAPSACNSQPWRFIVVRDGKLREQIAEKAFSGMYSMNAFAKQAPILIFVIREASKFAAQCAQTFKGIQYSFIDIGIACEHLVLQASEEGLSTCWIGWFDDRGVKETLGIPKKEKVEIVISLGYAQEDKIKDKNRKELSKIVEYR